MVIYENERSVAATPRLSGTSEELSALNRWFGESGSWASLARLCIALLDPLPMPPFVYWKRGIDWFPTWASESFFNHC